MTKEEHKNGLTSRVLGGTFELIREIGRGGMGTVYEARHLRLDCPVAVKILPLHLSAEKVASQRFRREAMAASKLGHPGIVRVTELNQEGDLTYMVMELLEGEDLHAFIARRGAIPWPEALTLFRSICEPMIAAHEAGYMHRDLKPSNIFLARIAGCGIQVKIIDFGLARAIDSLDDGTLTPSNSIVGTPGYMAPEQIEGQAVDIRADIFALGVILHELLSGKTPFHAPSITAKLSNTLLNQPAAITEAVQDIPNPVQEAIFRALAKNPADRFPDVRAFLAALGTSTGSSQASQELDARSTAPSPSPPGNKQPRGGRIAWLIASVLALLLIAGGMYFALRQKGVSSPTSLGMTPTTNTAPDIGSKSEKIMEVDQEGMVLLSAGRFRQGSEPGEIRNAMAWCQKLWKKGCKAEWFSREGPAHDVVLDAFWLDRNEVTISEFASWLDSVRTEIRQVDQTIFRGAEPLLELDDQLPIRVTEGHFAVTPGSERQPAVLVTWFGAAAYCKAQGQRLPTEAEWERAARGQARRVFAWGDEEPACSTATFGRDATCGGESFCPAARVCLEGEAAGGPSPVGSHPRGASPEGLHDLSGNVWEWVADSYAEGAYAQCLPEGCSNPRVEQGQERVVRGGSWTSTKDGLRAAYRTSRPPHQAYLDVGFRCARSEEP